MTLRVMVLGASGFIGGHLVRTLAAQDWAVPLAAGRRPPPPGGGGPVEQIQVDATSQTALRQALRNVDAVVSCIAGNPAVIQASAEALFTAVAEQATPPRVIYLSSMAVYGAVTGTVTESAPLAGRAPYARAKIAAEAAAAGCSRVTLLRPGIVYGPGSRQWTDRIARWLQTGRLGDLGTAGDGCCNLVHVDDVVAAVCRTLRSDSATVNGPFNLAMKDPPTWNEYLVRFARVLDAVPVTRIGPRRLAVETRLLAPPLKVAELILGRFGLAGSLPEPIPPSLLHLWSQDIHLDCSRAEQELQLEWTGLETGLRGAADWFRRRAQ